MASDLIDVTLSLYPQGMRSTYRAQWSSTDSALPTEHGDSDISIFPELFDSPIVTRRLPLKPRSFAAMIGDAKEMGSELYERIFQGNIKNCYDEAYEKARRSQKRLRLRIHLPVELENLPFELLYDKRRDIFVAANEFTTLVRGSMGKTVNLAATEFPLRVLIVAAQPTGVSPLEIDHEIEIINRGLSGLVEIGIWQVDVLRGPGTLQQLRDRADRRQFHVMHYIGHGVIENNAPALAFENDRGELQLSETSTISAVLVGYTSLRLVVLSSCYGGHGIEGEPYASLAHHLLRTEIPAVVAMQRKIADESAIRFTGELYRELSEGRTVDECVNSARMSLTMSQTINSALDWFNPQVYLRSVSGQLFDTADGIFPWEQRVANSLERSDLRGAFALIEKSQRWRAVSESSLNRLRSRLIEFGREATEQRDWVTLALLSTECERVQLSVPGSHRWKQVLSNRQHWQLAVFARLREDLESGDLARASNAILEGRELVNLPIHNPAEARRLMYNDDSNLFDLFWVSDLRILQEILQSYDGPLLTAHIQRIAQSLETLCGTHGLPTLFPNNVDFPYERETEREENRGRQVRLIDRLMVHPAVSVQQMQFARELVLSDSSYQADSIDEVLVRLKPILQRDFPLLLLALGMRDKAIGCWLAELEVSQHATERMRIHHHLALMAFTPQEGTGDNTKVWFDERALACWAILLSEDTSGRSSYWDSISDGLTDVESTPAKREAIRERLKAAIVTQLCEPKNESSGSKSLANSTRDIALVDMQPSESPVQHMIPPPGEFSQRASWFTAELAGAQFIREVGLRLPTQYLDPPVGFAGCQIFNLHGRLRAFYEALREQMAGSTHDDHQSNALKHVPYDPKALLHALKSPSTEESTRETRATVYSSPIEEMRLYFSGLRTFWTVVRYRDDPRACLEMLGQSTLPFPSSHLSSDNRDLQFLQRMPDEWKVKFSSVRLEEFDSEYPLHGSDSEALRLFCQDLRRVYLLSLVKEARRRLWGDDYDPSCLDPIVELIVVLQPEWVDAQQWITELQEHLMLKSAGNLATDDIQGIQRGIETLRIAAKLDRNASIAEAISCGLMRLAGVRVRQDGNIDEILPLLVEARQWDPNSIEACQSLCAAMFGHIKLLLEIGNQAEAKYHIQALREQLAIAPLQTVELISICDQLNELRCEITLTPDPPLEAWRFSTDTDGWHDRMLSAEQAMLDGRIPAALDALSDAALLVEDNTPESVNVRDKFLEFSDAAELVGLAALILDRARRVFPDDAAIEGRLRRSQNVARLISPELEIKPNDET